MAAIEFVSRQFRSATRVENPVGGVDQPYCQNQQGDSRGGRRFYVEATGEQNLPQHRDDRGIQAKEIWPEPEPGCVRGGQDPLCFVWCGVAHALPWARPVVRH